MDEPGTSPGSVSKRSMRRLEADQREITASILYNENEHKNSARLDTNLQAYRATVKQICKDLQSVGIEIAVPRDPQSCNNATPDCITAMSKGCINAALHIPPLLRKSVAMSVMHDSIGGLLVIEYILAKRELEAWNEAHPVATVDDQGMPLPQQPINRAARADQQALHKRLFALMDQLRKSDKTFFDLIATLEPMGVSPPGASQKRKGPSSPRRNTEFEDKTGSVLDSDDAGALDELERIARRRLSWIERTRKSRAVEAESEVVG